MVEVVYFLTSTSCIDTCVSHGFYTGYLKDPPPTPAIFHPVQYVLHTDAFSFLAHLSLLR